MRNIKNSISAGRSKKVEKTFCLHSRSYEVTGKVCVVELEMSLIVEFQKGRRVGVLLLQMNVVNFRLFRGESTVLTDVNL